MHAFNLSEDVHAPLGLVFKAITDLRLYRAYTPALTGLEPLAAPGGDALAPGTRWRESRRGTLLFLRPWATLECTALTPGQGFTVNLDDGFNVVNFRYTLATGRQSPPDEWTTVSLSVECFKRHGAELFPSEKLACMLRKQDKDSLVRMKTFIEFLNCGAEEDCLFDQVLVDQALLAQ